MLTAEIMVRQVACRIHGHHLFWEGREEGERG
jgi:hypothetical protein